VNVAKSATLGLLASDAFGKTPGQDARIFLKAINLQEIMKHASNQRRGRSRGNGRRPPSGKNRNYESSGPESKVRGSAQQILDKYLALARDAMSGGDRIAAEGYLQHAEHYYRILNQDVPGDGKVARPGGQNQQEGQGQQGGPVRQTRKVKADDSAARQAGAEVAAAKPEPAKPEPTKPVRKVVVKAAAKESAEPEPQPQPEPEPEAKSA
jgi:cell division septation protein DedD